jgi:hypothetical protein
MDIATSGVPCAPSYTDLISKHPLQAIARLLQRSGYVHPYVSEQLTWHHKLSNVPWLAIRSVLISTVAPKDTSSFFAILKSHPRFEHSERGDKPTSVNRSIFAALLAWLETVRLFCEYSLTNVIEYFERTPNVSLPPLFAFEKGSDLVSFYSELRNLVPPNRGQYLDKVLQTLISGDPRLPPDNPFFKGSVMTHTLLDAESFCRWCTLAIEFVILSTFDDASASTAPFTALLDATDSSVSTKLHSAVRAPSPPPFHETSDEDSSQASSGGGTSVTDLHANEKYLSGSNALKYRFPSKHPNQETPYQQATRDRTSPSPSVTTSESRSSIPPTGHRPKSSPSPAVNLPRRDTVPTIRGFDRSVKFDTRPTQPRYLPLASRGICYDAANNVKCRRGEQCPYDHDPANVLAYVHQRMARQSQLYDALRRAAVPLHLVDIPTEPAEFDQYLDTFVDDNGLQDELSIPAE